MLKRFVLSFAAVMNLLLLDQVVKELAVHKLKGQAAVSVIPNLFNLCYVENRGMAWGCCRDTCGRLQLLPASRWAC